jgi:molybdopterin-guanine dinucleotide biosynthesis protein A
MPGSGAALLVEGFVLAGGRSSRMGRDKALVAMAGRPLIEHALEKLRAVCPNPRIAGSRPDLAAFAPVVEDLHPGLGPLAGIEAGLAQSRAELNLFLPVDVPLLPVAFLRWMLDRSGITGALATVPLLAGWPQPLCAVYHRDLLPGISRSMKEGDSKVIRVILEAARALSRPVDLFSVEAVAPAQRSWPVQPPVYRWFRNLNRPEDIEVLL